MRFDPDLAVAILRELEARDDADGSEPIDLAIPGRSGREVAYHVALLAEAGLLLAVEELATTPDGLARILRPTRLTWNGHEALAEADRPAEPIEPPRRRKLPGRLRPRPQPDNDVPGDL
jgi:hypothetical protein